MSIFDAKILYNNCIVLKGTTMTDKQINITANILTGVTFILFILGFKYILAIGILLFALFLYVLFTTLF